MANATLSPRQLATLLAALEDAQRIIAAMRSQLIDVMAARRRPEPQRASPRRRVKSS
jgi:hypothetical protein